LETKELIRITGVNSSISSTGPLENGFAEFLHKQGVLANAEGADSRRLVCIDYSHKFSSQISRENFQAPVCILVRMEPSVVLPANYARARRKQFGTVITVGGNPIEDPFSVHWPLVYPSAEYRTELQSSKRLEMVVLVNGNKMSFVRGELYSLRRIAIKKLKNLDLFGTQWNSGFLHRALTALFQLTHAISSLKLPQPSGISLWFQRYQNYMGPVDDKLGTMSRYKYALIIENSAEYMSEKLMEALFAGCIPIYVGPNPESYGIPKDLVVWAEPTIRSIQRCLEVAASWDIDQFHSRLNEYLNSSVARNSWDHEAVYCKILEKIPRTLA
jgi:hypothetical protein